MGVIWGRSWWRTLVEKSVKVTTYGMAVAGTPDIGSIPD